MLNSEPLKPAGRDPFIGKIIDPKGKGWLFYVLVCVGIALVPVLASLLDNSFLNNSLSVDALHDLGYHTQFLIMLPFFVFLMFRYFNRIETALITLKKSGNLIMSDEQYAESVKYSNKLYSHWIINFIPVIFSFILTIYIFYTYNLTGHNSWNSSNGFGNIKLTSVLCLLPLLPFYYLIAANLIRIGLTYWILKKFLWDNVNIHPLHPDRCGGFSPLGKISLQLSWAGIGIGVPIMFLISFNISKYDLSAYNLINILNFLGYISALTALFWLPLLSVKQSMVRAKNAELKMISEKYQHERIKIIQNKNERQSEDSNLEDLLRLYRITESMPVLPFNTRNVISFLSSILWPVTLVVGEYFIEKI